MTDTTLVFGHGAAGRATTTLLRAQGRAVRVAQRTRPQDLAAGATFMACDVRDASAVRRAVEGCSQVVLAVGFAYDLRTWRELCPSRWRT